MIMNDEIMDDKPMKKTSNEAESIMSDELNIGDILYRYVSAVPPVLFQFEVIALHQYKDVTQYHMKSLTCGDHDPCEILVVNHDYKHYSFVKMLNNDDGDEDQRHWHVYGELLYRVKEQALLDKMQKIRSEKVEEITKIEGRLKREELELKKINGYIDEYNMVLNKLEENQ